MFDHIESDYMIDGEAIDGEAIIRLRPEIETYIMEQGSGEGPFIRTELYWNLKDVHKPEGPFVYQIHFFREVIEDDNNKCL